MRLSEADFARITQGPNRKAKGPKAPKETDIQNAIREYLRWQGWFVIRHQQTLGSHKGLSDLTAIKDGRTVYIEVKTPAGHLSDVQQGFRDDIEAHGGVYVVARCVEDVKGL